MKTLQEIMIEKYPSGNENKDEIDNENKNDKQENKNDKQIEVIDENKNDKQIEVIDENNNENQIEVIDENKIKKNKIKKLITSILASLTILFLFYPYMNNIIKENTTIFFENKKPKMILFICYLLILTLISKIIFTIS